jgi:hypothetical protein
MDIEILSEETGFTTTHKDKDVVQTTPQRGTLPGGIQI